jgi:hypothetical protein
MCTAVEDGYFRVLTTQGHSTHFVHCGHTGLQVFIVFLRVLFAFKKYVRPKHDVLRWPPGPTVRDTHVTLKRRQNRTATFGPFAICSSPRYIFFQLQDGFTLRLELRFLHFNCGCQS